MTKYSGDQAGPVLVGRRGPALWITLNRPAVRNAFNEEVLELVADGIRAATAERAVRAVVLTGVGDRAFCVGADLKPGVDGSVIKVDIAKPGHPDGHLFRLMEACPLPLIARVNGDAMGAGVALVAGCDLAVAADTARFAAPEAKVGLFPMVVSPWLMRSVNRKIYFEMVLTGDPIDARTAHGAGLVNRVVSPAALDAAVADLVDRIARASAADIAAVKTAWRACQDMTVAERLAYAEDVGAAARASPR